MKKISNREGLSGIPTGFRKLDELTSGWQPSDLIIIAARPGMGKTALSFQWQEILLSMEMPCSFIFVGNVFCSVDYCLISSRNRVVI